MLLTAQSRTPVLLAIVGTLAGIFVAAGIGGLILAVGYASQWEEQLGLLCLSGVLASLGVACAAAAHMAYFGSLRFLNEQQEVLVELDSPPRRVALPLAGACRAVEVRHQDDSDGDPPFFSVTAPSQLGRILLWEGSDPESAERWRSAAVAPNRGLLLSELPPRCGVLRMGREVVSARGGYGAAGSLFILSLVCLLTPPWMIVTGWLLKNGYLFLLLIAGLSFAGFIAILLIFNMAIVKIWISADALWAGRYIGTFPLQRPDKIPRTLDLSLSKYPWVRFSDPDTGRTVFTFFLAPGRLTLEGALWLAAAVRELGNPNERGTT